MSSHVQATEDFGVAMVGLCRDIFTSDVLAVITPRETSALGWSEMDWSPAVARGSVCCTVSAVLPSVQAAVIFFWLVWVVPLMVLRLR